MKLPVLPSRTSLHGKRVLMRVDWNISLEAVLSHEDVLKLERTYGTIRDLVAKGAKIVLLTHLGRPKKRDVAHSTAHLVPYIEHGLNIPIVFCAEDLERDEGRKKLSARIEAADPGSVFLLENVRFLKGEEKNSVVLAKIFASLADYFVNDAFASCHRAHASVVGVTKFLPSYAGPGLCAEVNGLTHALHPKKPFFAIIGGAKISTKMDTIKALVRIADRVFIGGAMSHAFFAARGLEIGRSYVEKEGIPLAKKLLRHPTIALPLDALVVRSLNASKAARVVPLEKVGKTDMMVDIGTETMKYWAQEMKKAKTIVWNGPLGMAEEPAFAHGSLVMARMIAMRSKGKCFGLIGGGDTLPVALRSGMSEWIDHLSTGGGAMLEFIANNGKLPGIEALLRKKAQSRSVRKTSSRR